MYMQMLEVYNNYGNVGDVYANVGGVYAMLDVYTQC